MFQRICDVKGGEKFKTDPRADPATIFLLIFRALIG